MYGEDKPVHVTRDVKAVRVNTRAGEGVVA
jgi:hypothetical protein